MGKGPTPLPTPPCSAPVRWLSGRTERPTPLPPAAAAGIAAGQSPCGTVAADLLKGLVGHGNGGPPLTSTGDARRAAVNHGRAQTQADL
jgi:hypothetical protein